MSSKKPASRQQMLAAATRVRPESKDIPPTLIESVKSGHTKTTKSTRPKSTKIDIRPDTTIVTRQTAYYNMVTVMLMLIGVASLIATAVGVWTKL